MYAFRGKRHTMCVWYISYAVLNILTIIRFYKYYPGSQGFSLLRLSPSLAIVLTKTIYIYLKDQHHIGLVYIFLYHLHWNYLWALPRIRVNVIQLIHGYAYLDNSWFLFRSAVTTSTRNSPPGYNYSQKPVWPEFRTFGKCKCTILTCSTILQWARSSGHLIAVVETDSGFSL